MALIRPAAAAALRRWREVLAAALVLAAGLWCATWGGWFWLACGLLLAALAASWGIVALRRMRFAGRGGAPGVVEVVEGQIAYFGPQTGGFLALADLVEIALVADAAGGRAWRLKPSAGPALLIPVAAEGAGRLHDALAQLPGIDMGRIAAAPGTAAVGRLWRHPLRGRLAGGTDGTA